MLETKQAPEEKTAAKKCRLFPCQDEGQDEDTVEKAIVLEVDMVDDEEAWRQ